MTYQTKQEIIKAINERAVACHQQLMDAYLSIFASKAEYEDLMKEAPEFLAVLATAEYHKHWEVIDSGIVPGLQVLSGYFREMLSDHMSSAGCNDMPQELFSILTTAQKEALFADFIEWDKKANPDGWEAPTAMRCIPDFAWAGYFIKRAFEAISLRK